MSTCVASTGSALTHRRWNSLKAGQPGAIDSREALRAATVSAVDGVVARSRLLSCKAESEKVRILIRSCNALIISDAHRFGSSEPVVRRAMT